jgi:hypothetical protein
MCPTRVDAVEKRFCGLERTTLIQNSSQLCGWLGREHGGSIPLAAERAGFGALPGLRPSDSPRKHRWAEIRTVTTLRCEPDRPTPPSIGSHAPLNAAIASSRVGA